LRLTLLSYSMQSRFINLDMKRIHTTRLFCNKVWNASKFVLMQLLPEFPLSYPAPPQSYLSEVPANTLAIFINRWIMSRLGHTVTRVHESFDTLDIREASQLTTQFFHRDFCDAFIEFSKPVLYQSETAEESMATRHTLAACLDASLRLLHPYMPFITEDLWQHLRRATITSFAGASKLDPVSVSLARFPATEDYEVWKNPALEQEMDTFRGVIHGARSLRESLELAATTRFPFIFVATDPAQLATLRNHADSLEYFVQGTSVRILDQDPDDGVKKATMAVGEKVKVLLPLEGLVNVQEQLEKIRRRLKKANASLVKLKKRVEGEDYIIKAPNEVKERDATGIRELVIEIDELERNKDLFTSLL